MPRSTNHIRIIQDPDPNCKVCNGTGLVECESMVITSRDNVEVSRSSFKCECDCPACCTLPSPKGYWIENGQNMVYNAL